jgi:hypothetical protein
LGRRGALWVLTYVFPGVLLLPLAIFCTIAVWRAFSVSLLAHGSWMAAENHCLALGAGLWTAFFLLCQLMLGRPLGVRLYVYGHEFAHYMWVYLSRGRIYGHKVSSEGGYIRTDKDNVLIALAPYLYPTYCLLLMFPFGLLQLAAIFLGRTLLTPLALFQPLYLVLLGAVFAFHLTFSFWMIRQGQSDLRRYGTLFSALFIYISNLGFFAAFFTFTTPGVSMGTLFYHFAMLGMELWERLHQIVAP